jgi:hypothetical protein
MNSINDDEEDNRMRESLDFILSHLQEPIFPRKIMTKDLGYQIEILNKQKL